MNINEHIHILCATDGNYASNCGIMLTSVFENNPSADAYVLVSEQLSKDTIKRYKKIQKKYHTTITFVEVDAKLFDNFPLQGTYWSRATYYRLYAAQLLPKEISRVLYLDCDMIVDGSLGELWNTDLRDRSVAVVSDVQYHFPEHSIRMNLPKDNKYFNAGMLLINVDYWREHNLLDQFLLCIKEYGERLKFNDQDVLNKVLLDSKVHVDLKWNFITVAYYHAFFDQLPEKDKSEVLKISPIIIHYTGPWVRPWMTDYYLYPFAKHWEHYKKLSPWKWTTYYRKHHFFRKFFKREILWPLGLMTATPELISDINKQYIR